VSGQQAFQAMPDDGMVINDQNANL
jgi:hypothetical protein